MADVFEKLGHYDTAITWAARTASNEDCARGGFISAVPRVQSARVQGRCLAAQGKTTEAEQALAPAAELAGEVGYGLLEVLTLRDLKVHVLDKTGRGVEGSARLKLAIHKLVGEVPSKDDLTQLEVALGDGIDIIEVLR
eukprot:COSAG02_NODE_13615_length_1372_cov_1.279654_1_plen_139_part_00